MRSMPQGTEQAKKDGPAACADEDAHLLTLVKPDEHGDEHRMEAPLLSYECEVDDKGVWTKLKTLSTSLSRS